MNLLHRVDDIVFNLLKKTKFSYKIAIRVGSFMIKKRPGLFKKRPGLFSFYHDLLFIVYMYVNSTNWF